MRKMLALLLLAFSLYGLAQGAAALAAQQSQAAALALDAISQIQSAPAQAGQGGLAIGQIADRLNRLLR